MKALAIIFLLILTVYNLKISSSRIYKVKANLLVYIIGALLSLIAYYLWFRYDRKFSGFIVGLLAVILFFTFTLGQGIREDGFVLFLGNTPILKLVSFDDIDSMDLFDGKNSDLILEIKAHSTTYKQAYKISDRDKLVDFLFKNLGFKFNTK